MSDGADTFRLHPVGIVHSILTKREDAPRQGREGAPSAWIEVYPEFIPALDGLQAGDEIILLTWLHATDRSTLRVHPRGEKSNPEMGVFATRSPDRPNPIGLHEARIVEIDAERGVKVEPLEAIDGTPVLDIKPVLR